VSPQAGSRARTTGNRKPLHPLVIAAISLFVCVSVTYYAFAQEVPLISNPFTLHALVNNSVAVRADSPVRIAGIDVGKVQTVTPGQGQSSQINFTMDDNGLPVHTDATIRIKDRLFLEGGYYLELDTGSPSAPIAPDGYTIPMAQTQSPVQFYQLLSAANAPARAGLEQLLNTINQGLGGYDANGTALPNSGAVGLKQTVPQLTPALKDIAWITRALHSRPGDVRTLLTTASDVTSTLQASDPQLGDLVTGLRRVAGALAGTDGSLAQSLSGLDRTLQDTPSSLTAVDASLPPVASLAVALDPSLKLAPPVLDGLTTAVTELNAIVAPAERGRLLTTLKATFQQFPNLLTQLGTVFPLTKQVNDCLRTHITPVLTSVVPDGSLSSGRPVWQDFVHSLGNLASAGQNFDANGNWQRFLLGAGTNLLGGLGSIPVVGQLTGTAPSGGGSIQGSRPTWVGDLAPDVFQPGVACTSQTAPALKSDTAASDFHVVGPAPAARQLSLQQLKRAMAAAARSAGGH
jgi:virulence factor Mce-like protein